MFAIGRGLRKVLRGQMEGVGTTPRLRVQDSDGKMLVDQDHLPADVPDIPSATRVASEPGA